MLDTFPNNCTHEESHAPLVFEGTPEQKFAPNVQIKVK